MGRTFDAIHRRDAALSPREVPVPPVTALPVTPPTPPPVVEAIAPALPSLHVPDLPANAPYIEVGRERMEASPEVLAAPAPRTFLTPPEPLATTHPVAGPRLQPMPGTPTPVSGTLPAEVIAYHDPAHTLAAEYRALTTSLLDLRPGLGPRTLAFTTALAGTQLTAVLLNVGATAARLAARRVVVIEADLRQPTLAATLGLPKSPGLVEVLGGIVPGEQAVRSTLQPNLLVLPAGDVPLDTTAILRVDSFRHLLQRLALRADLLLLALPRWDGKPDVLAVSACCDALFVVAPEGEAEQPHVRQMLTQLPALGAPLAGTVLLAA